MTSLESRCLESFPAWLRSLAEDALALAGLLEGGAPEPVQRVAATGLTYLFKSLDLIPDGLEELGYIDDAFVLRVAASRLDAAERGSDSSGALGRLAADAELIAEFLGDSYAALSAYVDELESASARGRSVVQVLSDAEARGELVRSVRQWAAEYAEPTFLRDEKNLVKLRAFLKTRLATSPA
jgi:uncharacterized membrane protein YkvA (DUF1232 family)